MKEEQNEKNPDGKVVKMLRTVFYPQIQALLKVDSNIVSAENWLKSPPVNPEEPTGKVVQDNEGRQDAAAVKTDFTGVSLEEVAVWRHHYELSLKETIERLVSAVEIAGISQYLTKEIFFALEKYGKDFLDFMFFRYELKVFLSLIENIVDAEELKPLVIYGYTRLIRNAMNAGSRANDLDTLPGLIAAISPSNMTLFNEVLGIVSTELNASGQNKKT